MAEFTYIDAINLVQKAYGDGSLTWSETSTALANAGYTTDNYLEFFENSDVFKVVRNADGTARNITWNTAETLESESISGMLNSNSQVASMAEAGEVAVPSELTVASGATQGTFSAGVSQAGSFVFKEVAPAVGAAMVGCSLGKTIDGSIYNLGTELGLDPPWSLNPETWGGLVSDIDEHDPLYVQWGGKALQFLLGIDDNTGEMQAYLDEEAVLNYALWLQSKGIFSTGDMIPIFPTDIVPADGTAHTLPISALKKITPELMYSAILKAYKGISGYSLMDRYGESIETFASAVAYQLERAYAQGYVTDPVLLYPRFEGPMWSYGASYYVYERSSISGNISVTRNSNGTYLYFSGLGNTTAIFGHGFAYGNVINRCEPTSRNWGNILDNPNYFVGVNLNGGIIYHSPMYEASEGEYPFIVQSPYRDFIPTGYFCVFDYTESGGAPEGTGDQGGASIPSNPQWQDTTDVKNWLDTNLPGWDSGAVTNTVPQPNGTTKTYKYVKVPYPVYNDETETNPSTGDSTQSQPKITPVTYPYPQTIVKTITTPITPPKIPDTGNGNTPTVIPPTGKASALWSIYNPTQAELDSFGSWLWSSNFVEQLKKLFNDPMQAVIGVHKVFATPSTNGRGEITCGYIGSGVTCALVDNQYTTVNCGSVSLKEYFGNVFDYDPYTSVDLFLPFIGIVPLKTADVLRSKITVIYHVDVLTGACLAEVKVIRDNSGGIIYTFSGSCIVTYPVSSGSYMSTVTSLANAAINAVGLGVSAASGNMLAATMFTGGLINNVLSEKTSVQKSGGFNGASGAMGGKKPYLIISRPQSELADNFEHFVGIPSNETVTLGSVSGYARVKSVHVERIKEVTEATEAERMEIERLLKSGVLIQS